MRLQACVDSVQSAINAKVGGATDIELCASLITGGITPSVSLLRSVISQTDLPVHILVRPRSGDFLYDEYEKQVIENDIELFKNNGASGIVVGALNADGSIDFDTMRRFCEKAYPLRVTLHRAFDMCACPLSSLSLLSELKISTILTSGSGESIQSDIAFFSELKSLTDIEIMVACSTAERLSLIAKGAGISSFHLSGKVKINSGMVYRNNKISMGIGSISEYEVLQTSVENIQRAYGALQSAKAEKKH